ncbi:uncharacterized protein BKA78DRAFT_307217 [Phyllosticta capitalensis]|uniref:uncharacterized protein n=1 Tax=Phyllosticta capitalensis TaxID=121624 RepID=UPI0031326AC3
MLYKATEKPMSYLRNVLISFALAWGPKSAWAQERSVECHACFHMQLLHQLCSGAELKEFLVLSVSPPNFDSLSS